MLARALKEDGTMRKRKTVAVPAPLWHEIMAALRAADAALDSPELYDRTAARREVADTLQICRDLCDGRDLDYHASA